MAANKQPSAAQGKGGDLVRFYTKEHRFYCGIDLDARSKYLRVLYATSAVVHKSMRPNPQNFLRTIGPLL